jgi:glycosyltransferase involved in cell wall biosynthesis
MNIIIATSQVPYIRGGAEILAEELQQALRAAGHRAEIVAIPFKWYPPERILDQMLACRLLDLTSASGEPIDRVIGLKFPAYLVPHPHKTLWLAHQHRQAYELYDGPHSDLPHFPAGPAVRDTIRNVDVRLPGETRAIYTISGTVSQRLKDYCGVESLPLYHPPRQAERFHCGPDDGYLYFPSRLNELKRQWLVLEALVHTRRPVRVRFAGRADNPSYGTALKAKAEALGVADRVGWDGEVSEDQKITGYARCRGVVYPPVGEDLGYITLEAMLASKPVVTCRDAGGPLEFVRHEQDGLVAEPTPEGLAAALDGLWAEPERAAAWGRGGRRRYEELEINWPHVVRRLTA